MDVALPVVGAAGLMGLALGSYAVTAGVRISRSEGHVAGRSRCDACGVALGFAQTVPVASYLRLRGACAGCGARIDPAHLAGELAGAAVVVTAVLAAGLPRGLPIAVLGLLLVAAATVDARVRRLPDGITALVALLALCLAASQGGLVLAAGLGAAATTAGVLLALRWVSARRRGDPGLGLGDVKLIAALALWLGLATPVMVALAAGLGLLLLPLTRRADGRAPFGPAIGVAAWSVGLTMEAGWTPWAL